MAGDAQGILLGGLPHHELAIVTHVTRDRTQLYADRIQSPSARHAAALQRRADAMLRQQGVVRFGRLPVRRPSRPTRTVVASAFAAVATLAGGGAALASGSTYTVVKGDTLSELAQQYDSSVADLARWNNIANPDLILIGDALVVDDPASVAASETTTTYTVVEGDTAEDIAWHNDTTVERIVALNDLANPDLLLIGQQLLLPAGNVSGGAAAGAVAGAGADAGAAVDVTSVEPPSSSPSSSGTTLHLVLAGETLDSIAALYGVTPDQLLAANARAVNGVTPGMILKIPAAGLSGIQLVGVPVATQASPATTEAAAVEVATGYWAASIPADVTLAELPSSDNPREGFTNGYGVYAEPLAGLLERYGFQATVFYSGGDTTTLTAQLDSGIPVIAWVTAGMAPSDLAPFTDGVTDYNLADSKQAVVVYGYDESGVFIVDVGDGQYKHVGWADFTRSWGYFGGMAVAVSPL